MSRPPLAFKAMATAPTLGLGGSADVAEGTVRAVFSRFNVVDDDEDVTVPGAFEVGAEVPISAYQHTSWQGALPVGRGRIEVDGDEAILAGRFFLGTQPGRDTFETVKQLGPLVQWSYGYDPVEAEPGTFQGRQVRFLKRLVVHEVSPVLVGAGVGTATLETSAAEVAAREYARFVWAQLGDLDDSGELATREYLRYVRANLEVA